MLDIRTLLGVVGKSGVEDYQSMARFTDGHIEFNNGKVQGRVETPDFPVECVVSLPLLGNMLKAAEATGRIDKIHTTEHKLIFKAGGFRGHLPILQPEAFPFQEPSWEPIETQNTLLAALQRVRPFMGDRQPWMNGVYLFGGFAYATNGNVLVKAATGLDCEGTLLLPASVDALLKLEEVSLWAEIDGGFVVQWDTGWLRCACSSLAWPGGAVKMLEDITVRNEVSATWGNKLAGLIALADNFGLLIIEDGGAHLEGDVGGRVDLPELKAEKRGYRASDLGGVVGLLHWCDFNVEPSQFSGNGVAGVIVGKRL